jgi:predicted MFS family arabinose efflux permease
MTETAAPPRPRSTADLTRLLTANAVALWGDALGRVAIPLVAVLTLAATPGQAGLLVAASTAPFLALALPVGAWLDRVRRRPVMVAMDLARFGLLAIVPVADAADVLDLRLLVTIVLLVGTCTVFFDLAVQSHLPDLVGDGDVVRANARLATVRQTTVVAGPAAAGWLCGIVTPAAVVALTTAGYLWSALWLLRTSPIDAPTPTVARRHLRREIADGIDFVVSHGTLRAVTLAGALVNIATAGTVAMLPIVFVRDLGWAPSELGFFLGVGGVGGLTGALTSRLIADAVGLGRAMITIGVLVAPGSLLIPQVGAGVPPWLAALAWFLVLFKVGFDGVIAMSLRQLVTPAGLLGRVNGTMRLIFSGATSLGATAAAAAADLGGPRAALWLCGSAMALVWVPLVCSPLRTWAGNGLRPAVAARD